MNSFKILIALLFLVYSARALSAPIIQKDAAYFSDLNEDLAWFASARENFEPGDRRVLFLRIYQSVSLEMVNMFAENQFQHPEWVSRLMLKYVSLYKNALDCDTSKTCAVSPAWQKAFDENRGGKMSPAGQLLISISAHVNRDLPIALASIDSTRFDDPTYHQDFEKISMIFHRRMPDLIKIVQEYETCRVNALDTKIIMAIIDHAIGSTRDQSWKLGAQLAATRNVADEDQMLAHIEHHAHIENRSLFIFAPAPAFLICL